MPRAGSVRGTLARTQRPPETTCVTPESRLELLDALMAFEAPTHLFGGVAEDALLYGSWVRPHEEGDVLVHRPDLDRALAEGRALGFEEFEVRSEPLPASPLAWACVRT